MSTARITSGPAPHDGVCARTGRPFRAGEFVGYVPGVGLVLPATNEPGALTEATPMAAPERGICAETGREFAAREDIVYIPGVGHVLPDAPSAAAIYPPPAAILAALGFDKPGHLRDLQLTVADLQRTNPARLRALGSIMGELLLHGTTHHTAPPPPGQAPAARKGTRR